MVKVRFQDLEVWKDAVETGDLLFYAPCAVLSASVDVCPLRHAACFGSFSLIW
jgi:hypothetical protein